MPSLLFVPIKFVLGIGTKMRPKGFVVGGLLFVVDGYAKCLLVVPLLLCVTA